MSIHRKKVLAIINPHAGTGGKDSVTAALIKHLDHSRYELYTRYVIRQGHIAEMVSDAKREGFDAVIAAGGDGTVNATAAALVGTDIPMSIIPCGSGNGLARHLNIPLNASKALQVINAGHVEAIDYCTLNELPFFCTCGMGFDAKVAGRFANDGHRGFITYIKTTLLEYAHFKNEDYTLIIDGKEFTEKVFVIACANASQYGNNAFIAPNADVRDGLIDVTVIHPFSPLKAPILGLRLFNKTIHKDVCVSTYRASQVRIIRPRPDVIHYDGEPIEMPAELNIVCHPKALNVFTAAE